MSHDATAMCVEHRRDKGTTLTFSIRIFLGAALENNAKKVVLLRCDLFHLIIKHNNMLFNNNIIRTVRS